MASMFERYGGFAAVSKMTMDFYDRVLDSDVLGPYFENVDMRRLIDHQTKFIASVMGGPAAYTDDVLQQVHRHLEIDHATFTEMLDLLQETLEEFDVSEEDIHAIRAEIKRREPFVVRNKGESG